MGALSIKTGNPGLAGMPPGCDIAILGKIELHAGRLDGLDLQVLLSHRLDALIAKEARDTGKTRGEVIGYLLDLSLYAKS